MPFGLRGPFVEIRVHAAMGSRLGEFFLEHFSDAGLLVVVFDLVAARLDVLVYFGDIARSEEHTSELSHIQKSRMPSSA